MKSLAPLLPICGNPAAYLARLKTAETDVRGQIVNIAHMPYPADPLVEPELIGLTYYQVGLLRQAEGMAAGGIYPLEFFTDRMIGKPAQVNLNLNPTQTYAEFLKQIAAAEGDVIDVKSESEELGL